MIRVLSTSAGVVAIDAMAPARPPMAMTSQLGRSRPPLPNALPGKISFVEIVYLLPFVLDMVHLKSVQSNDLNSPNGLHVGVGQIQVHPHMGRVLFRQNGSALLDVSATSIARGWPTSSKSTAK